MRHFHYRVKIITFTKVPSHTKDIVKFWENTLYIDFAVLLWRIPLLVYLLLMTYTAQKTLIVSQKRLSSDMNEMFYTEHGT